MIHRRRDYALLAAACALPRAAALIYDRADMLPRTGGSVEKSDLIARIFLDSGTFGFVPTSPTAYTQPLYAWFMIAVYWVGERHWWSLGSAQIAVAVATALLVYEIGRRFFSRRIGVLAALIATLQPYLIWHDVHANREILDQVLGAGMFLLALLVAERRTWPAYLGVVVGVAILSNSRLILLPLALGGYLLWRRVGWRVAVIVPVVAALTVVPWVIRNKEEVGCWSLTTDARALWKANNINTYATLSSGQWIDNVPDIPNRPRNPQEAYYKYSQDGIDWYRNPEPGRAAIDECAQQSYYQHLVVQFLEHHPGEKLKLMGQATLMLWEPTVTADGASAGEPASTGTVHTLRHLAAPVYLIPLYILALIGLFFVTPAFRALALIFLGYETLAAWLFAGTMRYRVPWDFVLALLAAVALTKLPLLKRVRSPSQNL